MIHAEFVPPNFRCKVEDVGGNEMEWLTYAVSEDALRQRLEKRRLTVVEILQYDFEKGWLYTAAREAAKANSRRAPNFHCRVKDEVGKEVPLFRRAESKEQLCQQLSKSGFEVLEVSEYAWSSEVTPESAEISDYKFNNAIWTELKDHLFELFHGKCAYCEWRPQAGTWGAVEHYRPKSAVSDDRSHPGYFWLAYDHRNYFPCCDRCNGQRAKMTHFPVEPNTRAYRREDLEKERPLLLNPYVDNPHEYLKFTPPILASKVGEDDTFLGDVVGIRPKGEASVKTYNLNRGWLVEDRCNAQKELLVKLRSTGGDVFKVRDICKEIASGIAPYSAALVAVLNAWSDQLRAEFPAPTAPTVDDR